MKSKIRKIEAYHCPFCGVNLRGNAIPKKNRHYYGVTHFGRELGHYDMELDRVVSWSCPDCKQEFTKGD